MVEEGPRLSGVSEGMGASSEATWSVLIPVHDCAHYLAHALEGVVLQLGGRSDATVMVFDDDSSDDPQSIVARVAPNSRYQRNPTRLGAVGTFNHALRQAEGTFVHLLHGDDGVLPGYYERMEEVLERTGAVAAVCRTRYIDEHGRPGRATRSYRAGTGLWTNALSMLSVSNRIRPASIVVRRSAYEDTGGFREDLPHAADWEMWTRLAATGPIAFVDEVLAEHRRHDGSDTADRVRTGANIKERVSALTLISGLVPVERRRWTVRRGLLYSGAFAWRTAALSARRARWRVAARQAAEGTRCLLGLTDPATAVATSTRWPSVRSVNH